MLHQIGAGALGPVFRAYEPDRDRLAAVKLFDGDLPPERVHLLVSELNALVQIELKHSGLAAPLAAGVESGQAFLASEYFAADSLDIIIRDYGPAPAADALRLTSQLAGALDVAAAHDVFHGALHPRDVLIAQEQTRVTGHGVVQCFEHAGATAPVRRPYTAPERVLGTRWGRRADIFSLAAVVHELLWGRRVPGPGADAVAGLTELVGGDLARLQQVFGTALAVDPDDRFSTAREFSDALASAFPGMKPSASAAPRRRSSRRDPDKAGRADRGEGLPLLALDEPAPASAPAVSLELPQAQAPHLAALDLEPVDQQAINLSDLETPVEPFDHPDFSLADRQPDGPDLSLSPIGAVDEVPEIAETDPEVAHRDLLEGLDLQHPAGPQGAPAFDAGAPVFNADTLPAAPLPPAPVPMALTDSALERSRSAIWPLVLALVVGLAMGFSGGYLVGKREAVLVSAAPDSSRPTTEPGADPSAVPTPGAPAAGVVAGTPSTGSPASAPAADAKASTGAARGPDQEFLVISSPPGADVAIDGRVGGQTPLTIKEMPRGSHTVRITREGYQPVERRVVIAAARPSETLTVVLTRERGASPAPKAGQSAGKPAPAPAPPPAPPRAAATPGGAAATITIDSRPRGAEVFIDGKRAGTTPLQAFKTSAGTHAVRLDRKGYRRWTSNVKVVAGDGNRVTASLEK